MLIFGRFGDVNVPRGNSHGLNQLSPERRGRASVASVLLIVRLTAEVSAGSCYRVVDEPMGVCRFCRQFWRHSGSRLSAPGRGTERRVLSYGGYAWLRLMLVCVVCVVPG